MRFLTSSFRGILIGLSMTLILAPSAVHAVASSASYVLTSGALVVSSPLAEASTASGHVQLTSSLIEAGVAGQSASADSSIVLSSGWASVPIPVPEPGFGVLWLAGLILLPVLYNFRSRRSDRAPRSVLGRSASVLFVLLVWPLSASAVPYDFSYQGTLADAAGDPLAGPVDIDIALYSQVAPSSGEVALYSEEHDGTSLGDGGGFSVMIGAGSNAVGSFGPDLFHGNNVYLEIGVDGEVLSPRQPLSSVPWALVAEELASAPDLVNQVGDLESQLGSFPAGGDLGAELSSLSLALTAVQTALGTVTASNSAMESKWAAAAGQISAVSNQVGAPLTTLSSLSGGVGSGLGVYQFSMWRSSGGNPLIVYVDNGEGGMMTADEYTLGFSACSDPDCVTADHSGDLAYGHIESWTTCTEYWFDPDTGEDECVMEEDEYSASELGYPQIIEGADGYPFLSYVDFYANTLKVLKCNAPLCEGPPTAAAPVTYAPTTTAGGAVSGLGSDLALGADGFPVLSYYDTGAGLTVLHCEDAACSTQGTNVVDATVGEDWSHRSSIAIGSDGLPVIAYYHGANEDLGFVHCGNASCSSGVTAAILDSVGNVGLNPVIEIGPAGFPAVAYHDATDSSIHLITCEDLACTASSQETVATGVSLQMKLSLQFSASGTPTISWTDWASKEVRVVSCPTPDCSLQGPEQAWVTGARDQTLLFNGEGDPVVAYIENVGYGELRVRYLGDIATQVASNESVASAAQSTANSSQSAAADAQTSADAAQAAVDSHSAPGCATNLALAASACPFESSASYVVMVNCENGPIGSFCEGDGECSTDDSLNNCTGGYDVYYKVE